jgi:hypothetical protein
LQPSELSEVLKLPSMQEAAEDVEVAVAVELEGGGEIQVGNF